MSGADLRAAIRDVYRQVQAPDWAAANLDALTDVLRDASWLPPGPVEVSVPAGLHGADRRRLRTVLIQAMAETADGPRPVRVARGSSGSRGGTGAH